MGAFPGAAAKAMLSFLPGSLPGQLDVGDVPEESIFQDGSDQALGRRVATERLATARTAQPPPGTGALGLQAGFPAGCL